MCGMKAMLWWMGTGKACSRAHGVGGMFGRAGKNASQGSMRHLTIVPPDLHPAPFILPLTSCSSQTASDL